MSNDSAPRPNGRSSAGSPLRLTESEREQISRLLEEKGWTPQRVLNAWVDLIYGSAGHAERYCIYPIYPSPPRVKPPALDTYLLSDRVRQTAVYVVSTDGPPTPDQVAEALREHGIPSAEMSSEQARRSEPQVALPLGDKS